MAQLLYFFDPKPHTSQLNRRIIAFFFLFLFVSPLAHATYIPFNTNTTGNIGLGTSASQVGLAVVNGNVGIGTWTAKGGNLIVNGGGNVGIGSAWPGTVLDVNGTARVGGFTLTGNGAGAGNILVGNGVGVGTWMPASTLSGAGSTNYWLNDTTGNVGISTIYAVGIGTAFVGGPGEAALSVMNGNVGIGTWKPVGGLVVTNGNVGIGAASNNPPYLFVESQDLGDTTGENILASFGRPVGNFSGIVWGYFGTGTNDFGAFMRANNSVPFYLGASGANQALTITNNGNIGIGTTTPAAGLSVMNGNVGIGTWVPSAALDVETGGNSYLGGNVGISSTAPGAALDVQGMVRTTGFTLNNSPVAGDILMTNGVGVGTWVPATSVASGGNSSNYWSLNGGAGNVGINTSYAVGIGTSFVGGTGEAVLSVMNGNVGIGTWVPSALLTINGLTQSTSSFISSSVSAFTGFYVGNGSGQTQVSLSGNDGSNSGGTLFLSSAGNFNTTIISGSPNLNSFFANGKNVGINTTVPASTLSVGGGVGIGTGFNSLYVNTAAPNGGMIVQGNVGVGSTAPGATVDIQGNIRVSNGTAFNVFTTNVGIGSASPGAALDVQGMLRTTAFTLNNSPVAGDILMTNGVGVGTWIPASAVASGGSIASNYWSLNGGAGNVGINTSYAVGIGTAFVGGPGEAALSVMNGNVGIGTWVPAYAIDLHNATGNWAQFADSQTKQEGVAFGSIDSSNGAQIDLQRQDGTTTMTISNANGSVGYAIIDSVNGPLDLNGNNAQLVGIATSSPGSQLSVLGGASIGSYAIRTAPVGGLIVSGNVGIGSAAPGQVLDVNGTARMGGFTLTGNGAANGNVLVTNGVGVGTWMPASTLGISGGAGTNYWSLNGGAGNVGINTSYAVGIGTAFVGGTGEAALSVMNGNVGIGTWVPAGSLDIKTGNPTIIENGNVGIGSDKTPDATLEVTQITGNPPFQVSSTLTTNGDYLTVANGGNVGIGTWVPRNSLEISGGNIGIGTTYSLNAIGTTSTILTLHGDTSSVYLGFQSGASASGGGANSAVGYQALSNGGLNSTAVGYQALLASSSSADTAVGEQALVNENGIHETALGRSAGGGLSTGGSNVNSHDSLYLGNDTVAFADGDTDEIVIGPAAVGIGSYSVVLGESIIARTQLQGNVGIGTFNPNGKLIVSGGNVGIGSLAPGQALDVQGTTRTTGFTLTGNGAANGNVLVTNGVGVGTWMPASTLGISGGAGTNYWSLNGGAGNVGINTSYAVGIGTAFVGGTGEASLSVMNGNVGIGTWVSSDLLQVGKYKSSVSGFEVDSNGNVGIGTILTSLSALSVMNGNVGIGSWAPANLLDVANGNIGIGTATSIMATNFGYSLFTLRTDVSSIYVGEAAGAVATAPAGGEDNTALGNSALWNNTTGTFNTALGYNALLGNISGSSNTAVGLFALSANTVSDNTAVGDNALAIISTGANNTALGYQAGLKDNSNFNNQTSSNSLYLGYNTHPLLNGDVNEIVIGYNAVGNGNNSITLGAPSNTLTVLQGNVGIGSVAPGQALDVQGTVRTIGLTMSGQSPISGYVLTAADSAGDATWSSPGSVGGWTVSGNNVYETSGGNVGIGTINPFGGNLIVNGGGNVGIGTLVPGQLLDVKGTVRDMGQLINGNVGIGTSFINGTGEAALTVMNGNVGIGTWLPSSALVVNGNVGVGVGPITANGPLQIRAGTDENGFFQSNQNLSDGIAFSSVNDLNSANKGLELRGSTVQLSSIGANPIYFLTNDALNSEATIRETIDKNGNIGIGTYGSGGVLNQKLTVVGNIGIGTSGPPGDLFTNNAAPNGGMIVEGNVGIGSWAPGQLLDVQGTVRDLGTLVNGNVGIGTAFINGTGESALTVMNGNVGIGTWAGGGALVVMNGNVGIGTTKPAYQLAVSNNAFVNTLTTNKTTFMAVSYGTGAGASDNITIPAATFTKINFHSLTGYTLIDNGGNYSATNDWYTTPVSGIYMIITKFRVTDGQTQFVSYGQGAGTAAADTPTFLWCQTVTSTANRNGSHNVQFQHYTAGSNIEMFVYTNIALDSSDGDFQVYLVSAD